MTKNESTITNSAAGGHGWLAILPFAAYGLLSMVFHYPNLLPNLPFWLTPPLVFYAFVLTGLLVGVMLGFPRWAFAYLFWAIITGWWLAGMRVKGFLLSESLWLGLPLVFTGGLLLCRSVQPLRRMLSGLWQDWTWLAFGVFTFIGWFVVLFDENHHPFLYGFIMTATVMLVSAVWLYFRLASPLARVVPLIAALAGVIMMDVLNSLTWDWRSYYHLPANGSPTYYSTAGLLAIVALLGFMLLTGFLTLRRNMPRGSGGV